MRRALLLALLIAAALPTTAQAAWTWSAPAAVDGSNNIDAISCPTSSLCAGVDTSGNQVVSSTPASGGWTVSSIDAGRQLRSVSCPTTTLCVAGDSGGVALTTNPFLQSGSAWSWSSAQIDTHWLTGMSCAGNNLCLATTNQIPTRLQVSSDPSGGAAGWTALQFPSSGTTGYTDDPSCVAGSAGTLCIVPDSTGQVLVSTNPASAATDGSGNLTAWSAYSVSGSGDALESMACPVYASTDKLCVAPDATGHIWSSTDPTAGAASWREIAGGGSGHAVACVPGTHSCVIGDSGGRVWSTDDAATATSWTQATVDAGTSIQAASCTTSLCVLSDFSGRVLVGTHPSPPTATAAPQISGDPTVGSVLSTTDGQWGGCGGGCTYAYQWLRCPQGQGCTPLAATGSTYTVESSDVGATISSCVTATNAVGASPADCGTPVGPVTAPTDTGGGSTGGGSTSGGGTGGGAAGTPPPPPPPLRYVGFTDPYLWVSLSDGTVLYNGNHYPQGATLTATPHCMNGGGAMSPCMLQTFYPPDLGPQSALDESPKPLPTDRTSTDHYDVAVFGIDASHPIGYSANWGYWVDPAPSDGQLVLADGSTLSSQLGSLGNILAAPSATAYRTIYDASGRALVTVTSDGEILPGVINAGAGNVINAGAGNIIAAGSGNIIAAGSGNVINAGAYNFVVQDASGVIVAVINAGAGNVRILTADRLSYDGANIIAAGAYNVIAAGAYNVINAGAGNVINAGAYNLVDLAPASVINAGAGNVINAGAYNLTKLALQNGATFGPLGSSSGLTQLLTGAAGTTLASSVFTGTLAAAAPRAAAARTATALASGSVRFGYADGRGLLRLRLTAAGRRLLAAALAQNRALARRHRPLRRVRLTVRDTFTPLVGRSRTLTRTLTITPGKAHHGRR